MKYPILLVLSAVPLFALLILVAPVATEDIARVRMLRREGEQERAICLTEGKCMNKIVKCPAKCPEMMPRPGKKQQKVCSVDCAGACWATCKKLTRKAIPSNTTIEHKSWCNTTNHETLCESMVRSDPRKDLKSSPQGLVVILVNAAQAKANTTKLFINYALKNETAEDYEKSKAPLQGCLLAYDLDWVNNALKVDFEQVSDKQRCVDLYDSLRTVVSEVTYDCEWDLPSPNPPTLSQMFESVESLASIIDVAQQVLSYIGCNGGY